ncbi:hypothetical protein C2G38_2032694 [Gigaspora rosea]|uniref:ABC transmembrane type-1 domain-containing protein n=1 Tax=Gigaspora rosea TaxID=44941 RepID=A0A397VM12_9GLOM|nr:hypothetical protein C2G38_2032694 [Gigaspora rosea]
MSQMLMFCGSKLLLFSISFVWSFNVDWCYRCSGTVILAFLLSGLLSLLGVAVVVVVLFLLSGLSTLIGIAIVVVALFLLSGFSTLLGIAIVIVVLFWHFFYLVFVVDMCCCCGSSSSINILHCGL